MHVKVPFEYRNKDEFPAKLANWIGEVFYEVLPKYGYEIREEQIFTAFQLADAVCKRKVHFAEAGLGTGKTFAYLLTAVSYARFTGKPVVISCASTALQEQLAGPKGDIDMLSRLLNLDINARMAKDPRQYACDMKINKCLNSFTGQPSKTLVKVLQWGEETNRGERSEMPDIPDNIWRQVAWDETLLCEMCSMRGYCKPVKAREHYRLARDLIVSDHETFFEDLWTRDERIADGRLPLLPAYSAVIFDEGHKIILPAAMRAGRQILKEDIDSMVSSLERLQGARTSLISVSVAMGLSTSRFFKTLNHSVIQDERTELLAIRVTDELIQAAHTLRRAFDTLQLEIHNEQELHIESISDSQVEAYEGRIERAMVALSRFCQNKSRNVIAWVDKRDGSFWVVPRDLSGLLKEYLLAKGLPVVFSSATLSNGGDFSYFSHIFGVRDPSCSSVDGLFDFEKQVVVYLPQCLHFSDPKNSFTLAIKELVALLRLTGGRALILTNSPSEVRRIRAGLKGYRFPFELLWEDRAERGYLIRRFREKPSSVLIGSGFWEGIDVPGEALSLLVIWQLPFPPQDPLIEARRREIMEQGKDSLVSVDYPEMGIKLKQGCGRLIRTKDDRGIIAIMEPVLESPWEQIVMEALPAGASVVRNLDELSGLV